MDSVPRKDRNPRLLQCLPKENPSGSGMGRQGLRLADAPGGKGSRRFPERAPFDAGSSAPAQAKTTRGSAPGVPASRACAQIVEATLGSCS